MTDSKMPVRDLLPGKKKSFNIHLLAFVILVIIAGALIGSTFLSDPVVANIPYAN